MANQPNPTEWKFDESRNDHYCAQQNLITGEWQYTWASELRTPRSASNVTPLATQASQLPQADYRTGNAEQSRTLSRANGGAYETYGTDAITDGFAAIPADLGEPWQIRRQGPEQPHASRRGSETRAADPGFRSRRPYESYSSHPQLLEAQIGYGSGPAGYQPFAQVSRQSIGTSFPVHSGNTSSLSTGQFERAEAGQQTRDYDQYGPRSSTQQPSSGYATPTMRYGTISNQQNSAGGSSTEAQTSSASYTSSGPRTSASLSVNQVSEASAGAFASGSSNYRDKFKRISHRPDKFFVAGKVFMMLYIDNAGDKIDRSGRSAKSFTTISLGEVAHHTFRRFIVVEECSKEHFCHCLAITTYSGQGVTKQGVIASSHTMIYTGPVPPNRLPGEEGMNKDALRMIPTSPLYKLDPISRVNLRKTHPIEHNWKVQEIGRIEIRSLPKLLSYWRSVKTDNR